MKYDTKEKARAKMDALFAQNAEKIRGMIADEARGYGLSEEQVQAAIARKMEELNAWREEALDEAWRWANEPAAPSLKAH